MMKIKKFLLPAVASALLLSSTVHAHKHSSSSSSWDSSSSSCSCFDSSSSSSSDSSSSSSSCSKPSSSSSSSSCSCSDTSSSSDSSTSSSTCSDTSSSSSSSSFPSSSSSSSSLTSSSSCTSPSSSSSSSSSSSAPVCTSCSSSSSSDSCSSENQPICRTRFNPLRDALIGSFGIKDCSGNAWGVMSFQAGGTLIVQESCETVGTGVWEKVKKDHYKVVWTKVINTQSRKSCCTPYCRVKIEGELKLCKGKNSFTSALQLTRWDLCDLACNTTPFDDYTVSPPVTSGPCPLSLEGTRVTFCP